MNDVPITEIFIGVAHRELVIVRADLFKFNFLLQLIHLRIYSEAFKHKGRGMQPYDLALRITISIQKLNS
jgi:hypothetical protein